MTTPCQSRQLGSTAIAADGRPQNRNRSFSDPRVAVAGAKQVPVAPPPPSPSRELGERFVLVQ